MQTTIEARAAQTVLQQPKKITVADRTFEVSPPTTGTLILVSEGISQLPTMQLNRDKVVQEALAVAKDCRVLGDILATLILGSKRLIETERVTNKRFFGLWRRTESQTVDRKAELSEWLLSELSPTEMYQLLIDLVSGFQLGDFFGLTTFLTEINLLRPKRVV